jgi:hypothetical protein
VNDVVLWYAFGVALFVVVVSSLVILTGPDR